MAMRTCTSSGQESSATMIPTSKVVSAPTVGRTLENETKTIQLQI